MVWLETPTNPTLKLIDIKAVCEIARRKSPKAIIVVDNTFASAYFQVWKISTWLFAFLNILIFSLKLKNPIELGADIAMHSLTKYMNGHTDSVMVKITQANFLLIFYFHYIFIF